jgi:hypothetical protein
MVPRFIKMFRTARHWTRSEPANNLTFLLSLYKDWAYWPVPRQLNCHVNLFNAFRVAGGKPAASAQFLLNPDSSARGRVY